MALHMDSLQINLRFRLTYFEEQVCSRRSAVHQTFIRAFNNESAFKAFINEEKNDVLRNQLTNFLVCLVIANIRKWKMKDLFLNKSTFKIQVWDWCHSMQVKNEFQKEQRFCRHSLRPYDAIFLWNLSHAIDCMRF